MREKCPYTKFFLVRIFPLSDWIRRDAEYLPVFSPNAGNTDQEKLGIFDTFNAVLLLLKGSGFRDVREI